MIHFSGAFCRLSCKNADLIVASQREPNQANNIVTLSSSADAQLVGLWHHSSLPEPPRLALKQANSVYYAAMFIESILCFGFNDLGKEKSNIFQKNFNSI